MSHPAAPPAPRLPVRRLVFAIVWAVIGALIAGSLLKLAFFSGQGDAEALAPTGGLVTPTATVERGSVVNSFTVNGSVAADPGIPVRATDAGTITDVFVRDGETVNHGQPLFDVREQVGQTNPEPPAVDPDSTAPPRAPEPEPIYQYRTVTAPATGTLSGFSPLVKQQVTIGEQLGQIGPGTFTVVADLSAANQYRILDQPTSATITISGGPAPFECGDLKIGAPQKPEGGQQQAPAPAPDAHAAAPGGQTSVTGQVRCAVPGDQRVFAGLNASVQIVAGRADDVLVVPVTAVKGDYATGLVYVPNPEGGKPKEVRVELGLTDGTMIEVKSGLEQGQEILQYVPSEVPLHQEGGFGPMPGGEEGDGTAFEEAPAEDFPADDAPAEGAQP